MTKTLPKELTSYDLLKTLALVLMICDHIGHHFYPDEMWFRVLGRLCLPIWFFLIGYANTTELSRSLWIGGFLVTASAIIAGQFLLPINILFTMLILRYYRQATVLRAFHSPEGLRGMFLIIVFLYFPTQIIFEYGALAMLMVLYGFMVRHRAIIEKNIDRKYLLLFVFASFFTFFLTLGVALPSVSQQQALFLLIGFALVAILLWFFKPVEYPGARKFMAGSFIAIFQFTGRKTLEIYVAHIIIFRGIAMYLYPEQYALFDWKIAPAVTMGILGL